MTEHEQLKWISDLIGYESIYDFDSILWKYVKDELWEYWERIIVDVREIIFSSEFIVCLYNYLCTDSSFMEQDKKIRDLMDNLDHPTRYLYNLLK